MAAADSKVVELTADETEEAKVTFSAFDKDGNGHIDADELGHVFSQLGESVPGYKIRDMIAEHDTNSNEQIEFGEFLLMLKKIREGKAAGQFAKVVKRVEKVTKLGGTSEASSTGTTHAYSEEETLAFTDWINFSLSEDPELKDRLPLDASNIETLFSSVKDGIIMSKLINHSVEGTIDERALNKTKLNSFTISENQTLMINSAAAIGVNVVNIGPEDIMKGTKHLVLGMLWQIIRIGLFSKINLQSCPGLTRLLEGDEELSDLLALPPDQLLLRWVNFHLREAGTSKRINNFSGDIKDSEAYIYLLKQIAPKEAGIGTDGLSVGDPNARAEHMLGDAEKIGCRKFVRASDVVKGNPKLNLAFVAHLFNTYPGLEPPDDFDALADFDLGDTEETREERTFRNWMNSLGCNPFVNNLYTDLSDGMVLLQLFDRVQPGIVDWKKKVNNPPFKKMGANMKKIENLNYAVSLGKALRFSIVGIEGKDIFDGIKTLTLAVVWQLMRAYTITVLEKLSGSSKRITDAQIVKYVNDKLSDAGKDSRIRSFKDASIGTSIPIIDLVDAIKPGSINYDIVTEGETEADKMSNAKYAISMSRKIGAGVYALPEDVCEVKPKMVLTVFACLMARSFGKK